MPEDQNYRLAQELQHWLELFDEDFSYEEVPLYNRALRATIKLFREGALSVSAGDKALNVSALTEHMESAWFRAVYSAVEHWYTQRFGANRVQSPGGRYLDGAILIHGVAFGLKIKAQRTKVEVAGESAWIFFEDGIGEGEDPLDWITDGPDLNGSDDDFKDRIMSDASEVASSLRFIQFRSNLGDFGDNIEASKLASASLSYLQDASRGIISGTTKARGIAWSHLQMASETALKSVVRRATGNHKNIHPLSGLLDEATLCGVSFENDLLANWPDFRSKISHWRYGQGHPPDLKETFHAYMTSLQLVRASMDAIPAKVTPGFGILTRYAPWKHRPDSTLT